VRESQWQGNERAEIISCCSGALVSSPNSSHQGPEPATNADSAHPAHFGRLPRGILFASIAVLTIAFAILFVRARSRAHNGTALRSSPISSTAPQTLRLKGMTAAVAARSIMAPLIAGQQVGTLTITKLVPRGTRVKQGDLLVEFDRQAQLRDLVSIVPELKVNGAARISLRQTFLDCPS
jgi:hypothetical protein